MAGLLLLLLCTLGLVCTASASAAPVASKPVPRFTGTPPSPWTHGARCKDVLL